MLDCLSQFLFLRTFSLQLQLSPFEVEAFSACLSVCSHSALLDEIHCVLLKACIRSITLERRQSTGQVDWSLLDYFTWTEFLLPLLIEYRHYFSSFRKRSYLDDLSSEETQLLIAEKLIIEKKNAGTSYLFMSFKDKTLILDCLIALLLSTDSFQNLIADRGEIDHENYRDVDNDLDDDSGISLPLFLKGEDGFPEECILCNNGGKLVCCDGCPAVYHKTCLRADPNDFDDNFSCYECSSVDPMNSRLRLPRRVMNDNLSISIVGRCVIENSLSEGSNGSCFALVSHQDLIGILAKLSSRDLSKWIWRNYRTALEKSRIYLRHKQKISNSPLAERKELLKIDSLIKAFDLRAGDCNHTKTVEVGVDVSRSSARLCSLESNKVEAEGKVRMSPEYMRLAAVFDPFSYINRYGGQTSNLSIGEQAVAAGCPGSGQDSSSNSLSFSSTPIVFRKSVFSSLGGRYFTQTDLKVRVSENEREKNRNKEKEKERVQDNDKNRESSSTNVDDYVSTIIVSTWPIYYQSPVTSLSRFLEAIYITVGPLFTQNILTPDMLLYRIPSGRTLKRRSTNISVLNTKERMKKSGINRRLSQNSIRPTTVQSWISRLCLANDIHTVKQLSQELVDSIHPLAFSSEWFLTDEEGRRSREYQYPESASISSKRGGSTDGKPLKNSSTTDLRPIVTKQNLFWIGWNMKHRSVRVSDFILLTHALAAQKSTADDDDYKSETDDGTESNEVRTEVEEGDKGEGDGDEEKEKEEEKIIKNYHNHSPRLTPFISGRNTLPFHRRSQCPPKLIKRLARLGGMALLPFTVYPPTPSTHPDPPVAWLWAYRMKHCCSPEAVALQLRALEEYLRISEFPLGKLEKTENTNSLMNLNENVYQNNGDVTSLKLSWSNMEEQHSRGMFLLDSSFSNKFSPTRVKDLASVALRLQINEILDHGSVGCDIPMQSSSSSPSSSSSSSPSSSSSSPSSSSSFSSSSLSSSPSSSCWWTGSRGDIITCAASGCNLLQTSNFARSTLLTNISCQPDEDRLRDFWSLYNNLLRSSLQSWESKVANSLQPASLYCTKENNCTISLPLVCVANYLERQFLRNLIVKYKTLSVSNENSVKDFRGQNRIDYLLGEYAEVIIDILMEGGSLGGSDSMEVVNMSSGFGCERGDVVVHSTLYEELKESRAAVIEALLSTSLIEDNVNGKKANSLHSNEDNGMEVLSTYSNGKRDKDGERKRDTEMTDSSFYKQSNNGPGILTRNQRSAVHRATVIVIEDFLNSILSAAIATFRYQLATAQVIIKDKMTGTEADVDVDVATEALTLTAEIKEEVNHRSLALKRSSFSTSISSSSSSAENLQMILAAESSATVTMNSISVPVPVKSLTVPFNSSESICRTDKTMILSIVQEAPLPLSCDDPYRALFPLLSDPTVTYFNSQDLSSNSLSSSSLLLTSSFLTILESLGNLIPLTSIERFLATVFKTQFNRPTNRRRETLSSSISGVVLKRKLTLLEESLIVRTSSTSFLRQSGESDKYFPQVGDELLYFPLGHSQYEEAYPDIAPHMKKRGHYLQPGSDTCPDWIACRVISIDFEFPAIDVTYLREANKGEVWRGLVTVLQLAPLYVSQSAKEKEKEIDREKLREKEKEKERSKGNGDGLGPKSSKHYRSTPQPFSLKKTFYVLYRPGHECPEFLIRKHQMQLSLSKCWHLRTAPSNMLERSYEGIQGVLDLDLNVTSDYDLIQEVGVKMNKLKNGKNDNGCVVSQRRFSCTYDNGEIWSGRVARLCRDSNGIPLWSGAAVIWDSEIESARIEGREEVEDFLNEWELEEEEVSPDASQLKETVEMANERDLMDKTGTSKIIGKAEKTEKSTGKIKKILEKNIPKKGSELNGHSGAFTDEHNIKIRSEEINEVFRRVRGRVKESAGDNEIKEKEIEKEKEKEKESLILRNCRSRQDAKCFINSMNKENSIPVPISPSSLPLSVSPSIDVAPITSVLRPRPDDSPISSKDSTSLLPPHPTPPPPPPPLTSDFMPAIDSISCEIRETGRALRMSRTASVTVRSNGNSDVSLSNDISLRILRPSGNPNNSTNENSSTTNENPENMEESTFGMRDSSLPSCLSRPRPFPILSTSVFVDLTQQWINHTLLRLLDLFLSLDDFEAFVDPISADMAPDYGLVIPCNMYLTLMREKAMHCHYRQPHALLADARTVFLNAIEYNMDGSPIAMRAAELYRAVHRSLVWAFPNLDFGDYTFFDPCLRDLVPLTSLVVESGVVLTALLDCLPPARDRENFGKVKLPGSTLLLSEEEERTGEMQSDNESDDDLFFFLSREEEDE